MAAQESQEEAEKRFIAKVLDARAASGQDKVVLYVSGSFKNANHQLAEPSAIAFGGGVAPVITDAWNTHELLTPWQYNRDRKMIPVHAHELAHVIKLLIPAVGAENIDLVCHSMGNDIVNRAITEVYGNNANEPAPYGKLDCLVKLGSDTALNDELNLYADIDRQAANHIFATVSKRDLVLKLSKFKNHTARFGRYNKVDEIPEVDGYNFLIIDKLEVGIAGHCPPALIVPTILGLQDKLPAPYNLKQVRAGTSPVFAVVKEKQDK
jgi:esterase/lipase superfamily enzyme